MPGNTTLRDASETSERSSTASFQKSGGLASLLLAIAFLGPEYIYLTGNLRAANGPFTYAVADFLYGPLRAATLVISIYALTERIGDRAPRRINLARLTAALAAVVFVTAALLRATNRQYHLSHPELHLETAATVLLVWATLVAGIIATGWHMLGWSLVLLGWAGWTSGRLPRALSVLDVAAGAASMVVYLVPDLEGMVVMLGVAISIWHGMLLLRVEPAERASPKVNASQPGLE